jgi:Alpha-galactosidase
MIPRLFFAAFAVAVFAAQPGFAASVPISQLDLGNLSQGWDSPGADMSVDGNPLTIAGKKFSTGLGSHADMEMLIELDGSARRLTAKVGLDDETLPNLGSSEFLVIVDGKVVWTSGVMRTGDPVRDVDVDLSGARMLVLTATDGGDNNRYDHTNWADAVIEYDGEKPRTVTAPVEERVVLTPPASPEPRINGAKVYGARPGSPILYKIAASGEKPMKYAADPLPDGLVLDPDTGILTGRVEKAGTYEMTVTATNARGEAKREFRLVIGDTLALTPPMGWNSWNVFGTQVDQEKVLAAARAMVDSGLIDYGWSFINIDDAWTNAPASDAPLISGPSRHEDGTIVVNKKFPDMKGLVDAIHALGLKAGIYSSPGPLNCGGFVGSFGFEKEDAEQYAAWGFDYLKYDWCGYSKISDVLTTDLRIPRDSLLNLQAPYREMQGYLAALPRDIVYSLCQYGMGDVWKWGASVGGNLWRTTGDIHDRWASMSGIGFGQAGLESYAGPGHWNDPDMLVVGKVGMQGNFWNYEYDKPNLYESRLTPNEQYTHITLWAMLAAPLLIGCDMTQMDDFTLGLLTNAEVIDINQDPLGRQASRISRDGYVEVWARPLEDGSTAIALFNRGPVPIAVSADLAACGVKGDGLTVRDVWRQKDLGPAQASYEAEIPRHGTALIRVYRK